MSGATFLRRHRIGSRGKVFFFMQLFNIALNFLRLFTFHYIIVVKLFLPLRTRMFDYGLVQFLDEVAHEGQIFLHLLAMIEQPLRGRRLGVFLELILPIKII